MEALCGASEAANRRFAPPDSDWLVASEPEAQGVAYPAVRTLARKAPAGLANRANEDLADAIEAALTLVRYAIRQARTYWQLRRQPVENVEPAAADVVVHPR